MTAAKTIEYRPSSVDLIAELAARAPAEGPTAGMWPGLTFYRFTEPTEARWNDARTLSIGIVACGTGGGGVLGGRSAYDTVSCLVIGGTPHRDYPRFDASPGQPCLCVLLEVDPQLINQLSTTMLNCDKPQTQEDTADDCVVTAVDDVLMSSVVRFLRSLSVEADRRVLTPLYLQELVYRILQRDKHALLVRLAAQQLTASPIAAALDYIAAHLADPLTVTELARQTNLSQSAFSRLFRDVTGCSPYQFVKDKRLTRARDLLDEGRLGVTDVSHSVGYTSLSHFIKEFRIRFGTTPGDYVDTHTLKGKLRVLRPNGVRPLSQDRCPTHV